MKHSKVTRCIDVEEVRNSLVELQDSIVGTLNDGVEWDKKNNLHPSNRVSIPVDELNYWHQDLRRLVSFFV